MHDGCSSRSVLDSEDPDEVVFEFDRVVLRVSGYRVRRLLGTHVAAQPRPRRLRQACYGGHFTHIYLLPGARDGDPTTADAA